MGGRGPAGASRGRRAVIVAAVALLLVASSCGNGGEGGERGTATSVGAAGAVTGRLDVLAAASLTEVFAELGRAFAVGHPGVEPSFTFAGSSALARQLGEGAPADVFASADEATMKQVTDSGDAADPKVMARNRLAIVVERGNPKRIVDVADLSRSDITFVLCAVQVPCGRLGAAALERAGVRAQPSSLEDNVKGVVSKVTLGEADAGIVYLTDVRAAGDKAEGVAVGAAGDQALEAVYTIAVARQSQNRDAARAWIAFVLSPTGQEILARFGFLPR